jgi:hypothetical protein
MTKDIILSNKTYGENIIEEIRENRTHYEENQTI